jgi:hypothetical protein
MTTTGVTRFAYAARRSSVGSKHSAPCSPPFRCSRPGGMPCRSRCAAIFASQSWMAPRPLVRLEPEGTFRSKPEQRWLPVRGVEYFTAATPGFVWSASISPAPLVWIDARDRLHNRCGNMLVKLESLFTIAEGSTPLPSPAGHSIAGIHSDRPVLISGRAGLPRP